MFLYKVDEELALKLVDMNDAEEMFQLVDTGRNHLKEWLGWLDYTKKVEDSKNFIQGCMRSYADNKSMNTVILYKGKMVGTAGYNSIDWASRTAYIGYWLHKDYQGNGIMTRVARALTDYAFDYHRLNKVDIRAAAENKKSRRIPERLGFTEEGTIRQAEWLYDHYVDHVVYGMLKDEWKDIK
ncbi:GNAT family N-acetyltransferase [Rossellomorea aquimaris]|jgi:ribosomal-protein-serine acetyltransferase|uniref:Alanine acetyltransferase n=1 Tax=Rossellomorea aquimaris TaxID=189382 RepID=A0A1J6W1H6_9BACI|nr:GNAT family protein [Rossellomorea aquimaris]OIU71982.1 alanine acetyltransferase [Rossellomorea aquimaris]